MKKKYDRPTVCASERYGKSYEGRSFRHCQNKTKIRKRARPVRPHWALWSSVYGDKKRKTGERWHPMDRFRVDRTRGQGHYALCIMMRGLLGCQLFQTQTARYQGLPLLKGARRQLLGKRTAKQNKQGKLEKPTNTHLRSGVG